MHGSAKKISKAPSGIHGLDEIMNGGLPKGRPTLICGGPGCGKTVFALEFLVNGATRFGEPGVFMSFEENGKDLASNAAAMGLDLRGLIAKKKMALDYIYVERNELEETGEYDLSGLFIRLEHAINAIGAKRVALDTVEALFAGLSNQAILRAELRRLFFWLKGKGVTAVITGEIGDTGLTRQGLEEYVSDCVIVLDQRVREQVSSRRLRVVKYRGSAHGANEYPFLIDEEGISVLPITSAGLNQPASTQRISSGIPRLDALLGGKGYYKGSSILISGTAGTGKSTFAAYFADGASRRGERTLYFAFEESPSQIIRNMRSIGLNLASWEKKGLLRFQARRPTFAGLETHLTVMCREILAFKPQVVIMDPMNSLVIAGNEYDVKGMLVRLADFMRANQITVLFTNLTAGGTPEDRTDVAISSLIDTWLLLRDVEAGGERHRGLSILKSRGMAHSNKVNEFLISGRGVDIRELSPDEGVMTMAPGQSAVTGAGPRQGGLRKTGRRKRQPEGGPG